METLTVTEITKQAQTQNGSTRTSFKVQERPETLSVFDYPIQVGMKVNGEVVKKQKGEYTYNNFYPSSGEPEAPPATANTEFGGQVQPAGGAQQAQQGETDKQRFERKLDEISSKLDRVLSGLSEPVQAPSANANAQNDSQGVQQVNGGTYPEEPNPDDIPW